MNEIVAGIIRHALTALGGVLVGAGYLTSDEWTTIAGALAIFIGAVSYTHLTLPTILLV